MKRITKIRITAQLGDSNRRYTVAHVVALKYVNGYTKLWTVVERK
jgi:hypothetical protein